MTEVDCLRCGKRAPGLDKPPLPGDDGAVVLAGTCRACWELWLGEQVKLINEHQLSPVNPEHYRKLTGKMREYLGLPAAG